MPDSLNYQPSYSAVYYTPPRRIDFGRTILATLAAMILAIAGAFAYAKIQPNLESMMLRGGAVCAAAIATGILSLAAVHFGRVRMPIVAGLIGVSLALLVLYVMWIVWLHDVLEQMKFGIGYRVMARQPVALYDFMLSLSRHGTWSYRGEPVKGAPLLFWWLGEAGLILTAGVLMPLKQSASTDLICQRCRQKCRSIGLFPRFAADQQDQIVSAIESREFASLGSFKAPQHKDDPDLSIRVLKCRCGETNVLTLSLIAWTVNAQGIAKVMTKPLVSDLLISKEETQQIEQAREAIDKKREAKDETAEDEA